jgi:drug/metabolite transporter (DMT)-like permease
MTTAPNTAVIVAFLVFVVFAGANAVAVRLVLGEMGPFWSAALRFVAAGALLAAFAALRHRPLPHHRQLFGAVLFGVFGFGLAYAFLYLALREAPAGTTMLMLAIVPLLTVLLAAAQRIERLRLIGLVGAAIACFGIAIVSADQLTLAVPAASLGLLVAGAICQAESGLIVKRFPPGDAVGANAVAMLVGATMLAAAALVSGETFIVPTAPVTWIAMLYLIGPGSIGVFVLLLYVLERWTASATSYAFLLFPLVAIVLGALLLQEPIRPSFVAGGLIVLAGVYIGAVYRPRRRGKEPIGGTAAVT